MLYFESFHFAFKMTLDQFAPLHQKVVRNNNEPFMTKNLGKAIMRRSKFKNQFSEEKNAKIVSITNRSEIIVQIF